MQKTRGSAIVIAMLLVTAVGAVGFTFGKVLSIQITNQSLYENGVGAYYSAESGIEEGFLRYRYSRDSQVPSILTSANWLTFSDNVTRANLTSVLVLRPNTNKSNVATTALDTSDPNNQYYDLRMGSKVGVSSGDPAVADDLLDQNYGIQGSPFHINRDESRKIDLGRIFDSSIGSEINLFFKPQTNPADTTRPTTLPLSNKNFVLIEAKIVGQKVDGTIEEKKVILKNDLADYTGIILDNNTARGYTTSLSDERGDPIYSKLNLKNQISSGTFYTKATLYLKPIGADIAYKLVETGSHAAQNPLNGAESKITSTGYFGGINRTLEANIDLASGSLYDLYDYVIYKN